MTGFLTFKQILMMFLVLGRAYRVVVMHRFMMHRPVMHRLVMHGRMMRIVMILRHRHTGHCDKSQGNQ